MDSLLKEFMEFEKTEKLFELEYKGIPYWQAIRFDIYMAIENMSMSEQETGTKVDEKISFSEKGKILYKMILGLLKNLARDTKNYNRIKPGDLLYMDRIIEKKVDDRIVDPYFDFWRFEEICSVRRCTLRKSSGRYQCAEVGTSFPDVFSALGHIWNKTVYKIKTGHANGEIRSICEVCRKINRKFGMVISEEALVFKVLENNKYHRIYGRYYKKLLERVQPKAIMVECAYDGLLWPLYTVAKRMHIPVIELEHGRINEHPAYNYGDISAEGKELPDYLFSYGEWWHQYINMPSCVKVVAIGNPFLESRKNRFKNVHPDNKKVVFYSDSSTGKVLEKIILEFLKRNSEAGYKVYFKMHPEEMNTAWEKRYSLLVSHPNVKMVTGDEEIYELMAKARHHVSGVSTVLYEALAFNTKRYIFKMNDRVQLVQALIDAGLAYTFINVEELELLLKNSINDMDEELSDLIWKSNAKVRGQKVLSKIMFGN